MPVAGQTPVRIHWEDSESVVLEEIGSPYVDPNDPTKLVQDVKAHGFVMATFLVGIGGSAIAPTDDVAPTWYTVRQGGTLVEIVAAIRSAIAEDLSFKVQKSSDGGATWTSLTAAAFTIPSGSTADLVVTSFAAGTLAVGDKLRLDVTAGHPQNATILVRWRP